MYAFPRVDLPPAAIKASKELGVSPDTLYSLDLLQNTGICVVPASGFGQKKGRFGFRTTFLSSESKKVVEKIRDHYRVFCAKYCRHGRGRPLHPRLPRRTEGEGRRDDGQPTVPDCRTR